MAKIIYGTDEEIHEVGSCGECPIYGITHCMLTGSKITKDIPKDCPLKEE